MSISPPLSRHRPFEFWIESKTRSIRFTRNEELVSRLKKFEILILDQGKTCLMNADHWNVFARTLMNLQHEDPKKHAIRDRCFEQVIQDLETLEIESELKNTWQDLSKTSSP